MSLAELDAELPVGGNPNVGPEFTIGAGTTEISLEDLAFLGPIEDRTPLLEFAHAIRRFLGVDLRPSGSRAAG